MSYGTIPTIDIDGVPDPLPARLNVLDVREETEWRYGHIEGAQHIPLGEIKARVEEVPQGQTLVVCKIGGRSAQAVAYLQAEGLDVVNLDGGMAEWAASGRPMVSETGHEPKVV